MAISLSLIALVSFSSCNSSGSSQTTENADSTDTLSDNGFVSIFDGETLDGWEGDTAYWRAENGTIVGEITPSSEPLKNNTFLIWKEEEPADFELKAEYRISANGNSGINYRSVLVENVPNALKGYQLDIDGQNNYTGQNYEERNRTTLAYRGQKVEIPTVNDPEQAVAKNNAWQAVVVKDTLANLDSLRNAINDNDWNEIRLVAKGNRLQHYINGVLMSDVLDNDTVHREMSGLIGVQMHVGHPMKVEYRNIRIKK